MQLIFDDSWIDRTTGVRRVLAVPKKEPEPVLRPETPWETAGIFAYHSVLHDDEEGLFKLWYRGTVLSRSKEPGDRFLCYAESDDGVNWRRPVLSRFDFEGSKENNIILELPAGDTVFYNVIKDPDDPNPLRRYKALGFQKANKAARSDFKQGTTGVTVNFSADGIDWPDEPILVLTTDEITDADCLLPHRDPDSGKWTAFLRPRTNPKRRFLGFSTSEDFIHWTNPKMLLTPDAGDDEYSEFYALAATVTGTYRVGAMWVLHDNPEDTPVTTELVYSRDGKTYQRAMPREEFLPRGPEGSFDSRQVSPVRILTLDGELRIYYNGCDRYHTLKRGSRPTSQTDQPKKESVSLGMARLKPGHFCGLATDHDGMVETKWVCNYGEGGMQAIADLGSDGSIRAEIVDQFDQVIPGWDRSVCLSKVEASGSTRFSWGKSEMTGRPGQTSEGGGTVGHVVKLRIYLHRATLYGFMIGDEVSFPGHMSS